MPESLVRPFIRGVALAALLAAPAMAAVPERSPLHPAEIRCLAWIAYAEAAGEGRAGLEAVIQVVRNRMTDPRFPGSACEVVRQPGQFQPVGERPALRSALADPMRADMAAALGGRVNRQVLDQAVVLAAMSVRRSPLLDPTRGALYFVNPDLMDADKCPWFAGLKRTGAIGAHVFMAHYEPGEPRRGPALDCAKAGQGAGTRVAARPEPRQRGPRVMVPRLAETDERTRRIIRFIGGRPVTVVAPSTPRPITAAPGVAAYAQRAPSR